MIGFRNRDAPSLRAKGRAERTAAREIAGLAPEATGVRYGDPPKAARSAAAHSEADDLMISRIGHVKSPAANRLPGALRALRS
ncbi:hypothetical protein GCM10007858_54220 [Bradyrhizobium liaoningense]|nr:hypothetical protein GCM10007858_54220 [Bradyrhizobium liaoningense]